MRTFNLFVKPLRYIFLLYIIIIFNTGCENSSCPTCSTNTNWNGNGNNIHGSGNKVSEERIVTFFNSIYHSTVGQVNITYGTTQEVIVTTDDNIQRYVKVEVNNKKLYISIDSDSGLSDFSLTIDITLTELKSLTASSAGNINSTNKFYTDNLNLYLSSAGNISLDIDVEELHSNLMSAGNLTLKGKAKTHYSGLYSAGNLNAYSLETDTTIININSAGNAFINVSDLLDVTLTSLGSLFYIGHPQIIQSISSIGKIINSN